MAVTGQAARAPIALRGQPEGMAARLVAEHGVTRGLSRILHAALEAGDAALARGVLDEDAVEGHAAMNGRLHAAIAEAAGNAALGRAIATVEALPFGRSMPSAFKETFAAAAGGYDGMHLIAQMPARANGSEDGERPVAAAKGLSWMSPRGPVTIDAGTRDIVQDISIRRAERRDGQTWNIEFDRIPQVKDRPSSLPPLRRGRPGGGGIAGAAAAGPPLTAFRSVLLDGIAGGRLAALPLGGVDMPGKCDVAEPGAFVTSTAMVVLPLLRPRGLPVKGR